MRFSLHVQIYITYFFSLINVTHTNVCSTQLWTVAFFLPMTYVFVYIRNIISGWATIRGQYNGNETEDMSFFFPLQQVPKHISSHLHETPSWLQH